jgi:hypothetical protein
VGTGQANSVTSPMIVDGTILRADVASGFKAPYADTSDYARAAPAVDSARIAASAWNAYELEGKDTAALDARYVNEGQNAGGDLTGAYPNPAIGAGKVDSIRLANGAVTSSKIQDGAIARADVAANFKSPYADTADYARGTPAADSARIAANSYRLEGRDTAAFVGTGQANSVTSGMIADGTILRADVASGFRAPYADTSDYARAAPAVDSARIAAGAWNAYKLEGKDTTALDARYVNEGQNAGGDLAGGYPNPRIAPKGAAYGQVLKWSGSNWVAGNDSVGSDNDWVRVGSDSVLYTTRQLGIARGGSGNALFGDLAFTHTNLGVACTTGMSGESFGYCAVGGGENNIAGGECATVGGGQYNAASNYYATVAGGYADTASGSLSTVGGGSNNVASNYYATVAGGLGNIASGQEAAVGGGNENTASASYSFAVGDHSRVLSDDDNSAAFTGSTTTASAQVRAQAFSTGSLVFTSDHPLDPSGKLLNQYAVGSPELVMFYRGAATIGSDGQVQVKLPDYFDACTRNPMVQLTGVGTSDVYVAEEVSGNSFVIGGKPGAKVFWTVTGERKDEQAEIARILTPVEQPKTGALRGVMVDDDALVGTMQQLEQMGKAGEFSFRTAAGRQRYENMLKMLHEAEQHKNARPVLPRGDWKQTGPHPLHRQPQQ